VFSSGPVRHTSQNTSRSRTAPGPLNHANADSELLIGAVTVFSTRTAALNRCTKYHRVSLRVTQVAATTASTTNPQSTTSALSAPLGGCSHCHRPLLFFGTHRMQQLKENGAVFTTIVCVQKQSYLRFRPRKGYFLLWQLARIQLRLA
jgi:hypothetical protein